MIQKDTLETNFTWQKKSFLVRFATFTTVCGGAWIVYVTEHAIEVVKLGKRSGSQSPSLNGL